MIYLVAEGRAGDTKCIMPCVTQRPRPGVPDGDRDQAGGDKLLPRIPRRQAPPLTLRLRFPGSISPEHRCALSLNVAALTSGVVAEVTCACAFASVYRSRVAAFSSA